MSGEKGGDQQTAKPYLRAQPQGIPSYRVDVGTIRQSPSFASNEPIKRVIDGEKQNILKFPTHNEASARKTSYTPSGTGSLPYPDDEPEPEVVRMVPNPLLPYPMYEDPQLTPMPVRYPQVALSGEYEFPSVPTSQSGVSRERLADGLHSFSYASGDSRLISGCAPSAYSSRQPVTQAPSSGRPRETGWTPVIKRMFERTANVTYSSSGSFEVVLRLSADQTSGQAPLELQAVTIAHNWYGHQYTTEHRAGWLVSRDHATGAFSHEDFVDVVAVVRTRLNSDYPYLKGMSAEQGASMNVEIADVLVELIDKHIIRFRTSVS
ncbi:hypothetical protein QFC20_001929 [Naganishia adeliensis]|uniref:Uncharacterized protein n=1 Tax=Naganishia adeliensis TaxID=92952 RepID=A0ACC2WRB4_9TREE|nr:hypothetical protein QFC20_001929 [Naganishia adeliensis]